jgi:flavin-dependent dehydrogenase
MRIGIIGGGPGGSVSAATLARLGHEVHVFECEVFPRFHIGESLLTCNMPVFEDIGLGHEAFIDHRYMPKLAAFFEQVGAGRVCRFPFSDALPGDPPSIYQVERAKFDHMLLNHSVAQGATLHSPARVIRVELPEQAGIPAIIHHQAAGTTGGAQALTVDFVIDASGRETFIGKQLGLVDREGDLLRAAVYGHVAELPLVPGAQRGDIVISRCKAGWSWQIPLVDKWSVGLVLKREAVIKGGSPAGVFSNNLIHFPEFKARLDGLIPDPVRSTPDISYRVRERVGHRWALVGDAGGFIDPIFSSGVLLATRAGWRLGKTLHEHGPDADLDAWKASTDHDLATFFSFIRLWYDGHFIDNLFFTENREPALYHGIISLLAGNTTNPDNQFLALLNRRTYAQKMKRPAPE